jgi:hypothetical protein
LKIVIRPPKTNKASNTPINGHNSGVSEPKTLANCWYTSTISTLKDIQIPLLYLTSVKKAVRIANVKQVRATAQIKSG